MVDDNQKYLEQEITALETKIQDLQVLLNDPEMAEMAKSDIAALNLQIDSLKKAMEGPVVSEEAIIEENFNNVIMEVRPGVGGDEAKIWADDLIRMYSRFAELNSWSVDQLDSGIIKIKGKSIFERLKFETGVHRVQRVPTTEKAGRIHTSTASVVVLPEVPETVINVREDELLWEFTTGGGHGGQNVNKVATAVRLTHKPSGMVVQSRQERSQEQNRKIALSLLRSQLWDKEQEKKRLAVSVQRSVVGRSMRSEKIRTYNYPQNRVTDHRIGKSWHTLDKIMEGNLQSVISTLELEVGQDHSQTDND